MDAAQELSAKFEILSLQTLNDVLKLLEDIQRSASDDDLGGVCYQLRALLPECDGSENLVQLCSKLLYSPDYYNIAASLIHYILQLIGDRQDIAALRRYIECHRKFEPGKILPTLQLRCTLANVATEIEMKDTDSLVHYFAKTYLKDNPDRFKAESDYLRALKLFEKLEREGVLSIEKNGLSKLKDYLENKGRKKIVEELINKFDSQRPINLVLLDTELEFPLEPLIQVESVNYKAVLIATYNQMDEIPLGQWPPIKKLHYINLALITSDPMPRNDHFSRSTVRGSVDDVMSRKEHTCYEHIFPKHILAQHQGRTSVLAEGRPACGKSTLLTKVSKDWAKDEVLSDIHFLILVRLRKFLGREDIRLEDLFGQYCGNTKLVSAVVDEVTKNGGKNVCFLLDGLDEYSPLRKQNNLIRKLLDGSALPNASVIMASRPAASSPLRNQLRLDNRVEIIGFLQKEIEAYIRHAFEDQPHKAEQLLAYLQKHPNIARMCYLPLHLAMVAYLFELGKDLPDAETDLYYMFTMHTVYRSLRKLDSNEDSDDDDEPELNDLFCIPDEGKAAIFESICTLAYTATTMQKQIFTGQDIFRMKELHLPVKHTKKTFDSLGLLTVDRVTNDELLPTKAFSFIHLTLQEFLSACYLHHYLSEEEQLGIFKSDLAGRDHMWVVLKFYCGLSKRLESTPEHFLRAYQEMLHHNISSERRIATLNMAHCAFESKSKDACSILLSKIEGVMDINDVSLTPSDCAAIGNVSSNAHSLVREMDLSYCHIGPDGIQALVDQLEHNMENAILLRLRARIDRAIGKEGAPALNKLLIRLPNLEELRLYGNKLETNRFQYLAPIVRDMTKLQTLIVSRNDLDKDSGCFLSSILENLPELHTFYASYNSFGDKGLKEMKPGLLKCQKLKILGLRGTDLKEDSGVHLCEIFATLSKLETVELYQNKLGDKGVIDLLPGLMQAKSLQKMSLTENDIKDDGAVAIAGYLSVTTTLKQLRIYYNHDMSDVGKIAIRSAVVNRPPQLTEICDLRVAV